MADLIPLSSCRLRVYENGTQMLVMVSGSLRMAEADRVRVILDGLLNHPIEVLSLNTSGLSELDSAGLGMLVGQHMNARKIKKEFQILSPTAHQNSLFEMTRLNKVLTVKSGPDAEHLRLIMEKPEFEVPLTS